MPISSPSDLAKLIVSATRRLGMLGEPGQTALLEAVAAEEDNEEFDAGRAFLEEAFAARS